jgi:2-keto-4-pentenoate hydratase
MIDTGALARELAQAMAMRQIVSSPSSRDSAFDLGAAYAAGAELTRLRRAEGHKTIGVKVGFANKAVWRALKLETLVWGPMYDDTVQYATAGEATLRLDRMIAPKIEPEVVFRMKDPAAASGSDPAAALEAVEWLALGFEVIDCPFPDWKFQPTDFVAAFGLHAALIVGTPLPIEGADIASLVDAVARFQVRLMKNGELVGEGTGRNSLRSPALCLAELVTAMSARTGTEPLAPGDLVSSGTLTESQPIAPGDTWRAEVDGIALGAITVRTLG